MVAMIDAIQQNVFGNQNCVGVDYKHYWLLTTRALHLECVPYKQDKCNHILWGSRINKLPSIWWVVTEKTRHNFYASRPLLFTAPL